MQGLASAAVTFKVSVREGLRRVLQGQEVAVVLSEGLQSAKTAKRRHQQASAGLRLPQLQFTHTRHHYQATEELHARSPCSSVAV